MEGIDKGTDKGWAGKGGDERRRAAVAAGAPERRYGMGRNESCAAIPGH